MLCDYGNRYQSKLFNPEFLRARKLPVPQWLLREPSANIDAVVQPDAA
jgi:cysteine synthase A